MHELAQRQFLERLLFLTQRCRSITLEAWLKRLGHEELDETDRMALELLDKTLYGRTRNLLTDLEHILSKPVIATIDYYNVLVCAQQSEILADYCANADIPLPVPISAWIE